MGFLASTQSWLTYGISISRKSVAYVHAKPVRRLDAISPNMFNQARSLAEKLIKLTSRLT
jgi:hypothetical protein